MAVYYDRTLDGNVVIAKLGSTIALFDGVILNQQGEVVAVVCGDATGCQARPEYEIESTIGGKKLVIGKRKEPVAYTAWLRDQMQGEEEVLEIFNMAAPTLEIQGTLMLEEDVADAVREHLARNAPTTKGWDITENKSGQDKRI